MSRGLSGKLLGAVILAILLVSNACTSAASAATTAPLNYSKDHSTNMIAYQPDEDLEFLMDSETNRRFLATNGKVTSKTADPNNPAACGKDRRYDISCTNANKNGGGIPETRDTYKR